MLVICKLTDGVPCVIEPLPVVFRPLKPLFSILFIVNYKKKSKTYFLPWVIDETLLAPPVGEEYPAKTDVVPPGLNSGFIIGVPVVNIVSPGTYQSIFFITGTFFSFNMKCYIE